MLSDKKDKFKKVEFGELRDKRRGMNEEQRKTRTEEEETKERDRRNENCMNSCYKIVLLEIETQVSCVLIQIPKRSLCQPQLLMYYTTALMACRNEVKSVSPLRFLNRIHL